MFAADQKFERFMKARSVWIPFAPEDYMRAVQIARERRGNHTVLHKDNSRTTADPCHEDIMGASGEVGTEKWDCRFPVNAGACPGGDGGHDCTVGGKKIDIKAIPVLDSRHNLLQQVGRVSSDVYLLAVKEKWNEAGIWLVGWCAPLLILNAPQRVTNTTVNKLNHIVCPSKLERMETLRPFLGLENR